jgi:hypothetical protein
MEKKYYTKKEILESKELLNEDWIENALMIAGFVPVIGEVADIILIIRYIWKKEYLYAGLMLIALIPTVGDIIAKPIIRLLKGAGEAGSIALKSGTGLIKYAETHPQFAAQYLKIGEHLGNPLIKKTINGVKSVPLVGEKAAFGMEKSIAEHQGVIAQLKNKTSGLRPVQLGKTIGKEISAGGKFSTGLKDFFKGEKLASYTAKHGMEPSSWLSKWWNITMPARRSRRQMFKNFIVTNHILDMFGLPSMDAFEERFEKDEEMRKKLAEMPQFQQFVGQTTSPEELSQINGTQQTQQSGGGFDGGGLMGIGMLKMLAQGL